MSVEIGEVETLTDVKPDKARALKVLEEAAEVFGAWQEWDRGEWEASPGGEVNAIRAIMDECADVVQAVANLVDSFGESAFYEFIVECSERNCQRGRM